MDSDKMKAKFRGNPEKEIRQILKQINPDIKRLLELVEEPGDGESIFFESIRSGARNLRVAWRIVKKD